MAAVINAATIFDLMDIIGAQAREGQWSKVAIQFVATLAIFNLTDSPKSSSNNIARDTYVSIHSRENGRSYLSQIRITIDDVTVGIHGGALDYDMLIDIATYAREVRSWDDYPVITRNQNADRRGSTALWMEIVSYFDGDTENALRCIELVIDPKSILKGILIGAVSAYTDIYNEMKGSGADED